MKSMIKRLVMLNKNKKVVHYDRPIKIEIGSSAIVHPLDHTSPLVSNETLVYTSKVLAYDTITGIFITANSIYVPMARTSKEEK